MFRRNILRSNILNSLRDLLNNPPNSLYYHNLKPNVGILFSNFFRDNRRHFQRFSSKSASDSFNSDSVRDILKKWRTTFEENEISEPTESIKLIICHHLNIERISDVYKWTHHVLSKSDIRKIDSMCEKRLRSFPVQYIMEEWTFRDLNLKMKPPVFIPRPETEELVGIVKNDILLTGATEVVEICCGSGAICLSLLKEIPNFSIIAVDKSEHACSLTIENAVKNFVSERLFVVQHEITLGKETIGIFAGKENYFDIIVSNPPYVLTKDMEKLQPEIKLYEDLAALDGGLDGMDIIRPILRLSSVILRPGGRLYLEVDPSHPDAIRNLLHSDSTEERIQEWQRKLGDYRKLGLRIRKIHEDFNQKARFVEIIKIE